MAHTLEPYEDDLLALSRLSLAEFQRLVTVHGGNGTGGFYERNPVERACAAAQLIYTDPDRFTQYVDQLMRMRDTDLLGAARLGEQYLLQACLKYVEPPQIVEKFMATIAPGLCSENDWCESFIKNPKQNLSHEFIAVVQVYIDNLQARIVAERELEISQKKEQERISRLREHELREVKEEFISQGLLQIEAATHQRFSSLAKIDFDQYQIWFLEGGLETFLLSKALEESSEPGQLALRVHRAAMELENVLEILRIKLASTSDPKTKISTLVCLQGTRLDSWEALSRAALEMHVKERNANQPPEAVRASLLSLAKQESPDLEISIRQICSKYESFKKEERRIKTQPRESVTDLAVYCPRCFAIADDNHRCSS